MVDLSVNKCRSAGIKVIMVTSNQPPTAASVAEKVNILMSRKKEFNYLINVVKIDRDSAWRGTTDIVVHGDHLAEKHLAKEYLALYDQNKGQFL